MPKFLDSTGLLTLLEKIKNAFITKTGDETIEGVKTFIGPPRSSCVDGGGIVIRNPHFVRGTNPSRKQYIGISLCDSSTAEYAGGGAHGRLGILENCINTTGNVETYISTYKNTANNGSSNTLVVGYPNTGDLYVKSNGNGTVLLGLSAAKWKEIWCTQSSINSSSDERIKSEIESIPDELLDAWEDVQYSLYHFKDSVSNKGVENARLHSGLVAQRVAKALINKGLDPEKYGFYLYDKWEAEAEERDEEGNIVHEAKPAGDAYGLRYNEILCIEAAYQRRRADRLEARIEALEEKLK